MDTNKLRTGSDQLDNDTYAEFQNAKENNNETRHEEIIKLWRKTNFWIACIGLYFLSKIIISIIKSIIAIQISSNIIENILTIQF